MMALLRSRAALATLAIVAAMLVNSGWRRVAAQNLLAEAHLDQAAGPQAVVVDLAVEPEQFHMARLQAQGVMVGAEGRSVRLRNVSPEALRVIAAQPWVARLRRLEG